MTPQPVIKLELLGSDAIRTSIIFTHLILIIGGILTGITQLGYDRHSVPSLPFEACAEHIPITGKNACYVECHQNFTWMGLSDHVSPNAGEFKLGIDIPDIKQTFSFKYKASIYGGDQSSFDWTNAVDKGCSPMDKKMQGWGKVFYQEKKRQTCSTNKCEDLQIVDTSSTVWGQQRGGYSRYLMVIQFWDKIVDDFAGSEFTLSYRIPQFREFVVGLRTTFTILSLICLLYWVCSVREFPKRLGGSRFKFFCCCCCGGGPPLLRLVFWFLLSVALWQNPIFMIAQLGEYRSIDLNVVAEAFNSVAWSFLLAIWSLMAYEAGSFDEQKSRDKDAWKVYTISFLFGILLSVTSVLMNVASKPELFTGNGIEIFGISEVNHDLRVAGIALGAVYLVLLILWTIWFGFMILISWTTLSDTVFMRTRARQLIVRYFMWQTITVVLFVVIVDIIPVVGYFKKAYEHFENGKAINTETAKLVGIVQKISQGYQSVGSYFLVAVHALFLFYALLPPRAVGSVEGFCWKILGIITLSGSNERKRPFSVMEASWLFDFICAANYDPENTTRINADDRTESTPQETREATKQSKGPLEVAPHGFSIDGFIYSKKSGTIVIVFRKEFRVVLVFRAAAQDSVRPSLLHEEEVNMQSLAFSKEDSGFCSCCPGLREISPRVREDMWKRYVSVREALHRSLAMVLYLAGKDLKLYSTGFGIGGGVAALAAYDCRHLVENSRRDTKRGFCSIVCHGVYSALTCGCCFRGDESAPLLEGDEENHPRGQPINASSSNCISALTSQDSDNQLNTMFRKMCGSEPITRPDVCVGEDSDVDNSSTSANERNDIVRVYTFGTERVGNFRFTAKYKHAIPWTFNVSTEGDYFTRRPEERFPLKQPGNFVLIDKRGNVLQDPSLLERALVVKGGGVQMHDPESYKLCLYASRFRSRLYVNEEVANIREEELPTLRDGIHPTLRGRPSTS
eukprot:gb/GECG01004775.1/.p1 GENE.gb/GECG01004775.1/~~gb/GECG01004775.1/.p1  ORF type:complete len:965 (+),score=73.58 gb/GECG01004775.1/:1-2895(+)